VANWYDIVHLDRLVPLTGTLVGDYTIWTYPVEDDTIDTIVLGPAFNTDAGEIITPTSVVASGGTTTVAVNDRDLTAGQVAIGRSYSMSVKLTQPFVRDEDSVDTDGRFTVQRIVARYHKTAGLRVRVDYPDVRDLGHVSGTYAESLDVDPLIKRGDLVAFFGGDAKNLVTYLENLTPKPSTVVSVEFNGQYTSGITE